MKRISLTFMLLISVLVPLSGVASDRLKVHILSLYSLSSVRIKGSGLHWQANDSREVALPGGAEIFLQVSGGKIHLDAVSVSQDFTQLETAAAPGTTIQVRGAGVDRNFTGKLRVTVKNGALFFVEKLPLEDYVADVLASEMPLDFPAEAQKAQAVLIRTYALSHLGRHSVEGFDFCDLTHCQADAGWDPSPHLSEAVEATRSLVLNFQGHPAETLYHSTCGGHTSANQKVFGGKPLPYLQGVSDGDYCAKSPHHDWEGRMSQEELSLALGQSVRGLETEEREPEGRVFTLAVDGKVIPVMAFLSEVGRRYGWNRLKSNWFELTREGRDFRFVGHGLGHGVGLCQWGARGMAEAGKKFPEILGHYFPKTRLERR